MRYVIAVDGGQSSTLALVATDDGRILGYGRGGASNHIHEPGGIERLTKALHDSIGGALQDANLRADVIDAACLGLSGGPLIALEIGRWLLPAAQITVHKDLVTAWAGAGLGQPGVIIIAGTGAAAYGRLADEREVRAGGWGYLMGDEGSAYDIGIAALKAAACASDGRGPLTALSERIPAHLAVDNLRAVHGLIYSEQISRPQIAGLAAVVGQAAHDGDGVARSLLAQAGEHLGRAAAAVIEALDMAEDGLPVYVTGGVFAAGDYVLGPLRVVVESVSPASTVSAARYPQVVGALLLALAALDIEPQTGVLQQIESTLPHDALDKHAKRE